MEIKKAATAGTLESSDCMVTVEPGEGKIDFSLESSVIHQYGNQLRKVALETAISRYWLRRPEPTGSPPWVYRATIASSTRCFRSSIGTGPHLFRLLF